MMIQKIGSGENKVDDGVQGSEGVTGAALDKLASSTRFAKLSSSPADLCRAPRRPEDRRFQRDRRDLVRMQRKFDQEPVDEEKKEKEKKKIRKKE